MTLDRQGSNALFGRRWRSPYYIVAPCFNPASAGVRVLYMLAHTLNQVGEEAYVWPAQPLSNDDEWQPFDEGLQAPRLRQADAEAHFQFSRCPIVVYPEIYTDNARKISHHSGLKVRLIMNYLGYFGAYADSTTFDLDYAYSKNIALSMTTCDGLLHIPTADPDFWTPPLPTTVRSGSCAYIGKFVEHHHQPMPKERTHPFIISKLSADSPNKDELRRLFQTSTHLYIYENTAVAIEAALCGCPVVYRFNPLFKQLISEVETGMNGFVENDDDVSLLTAKDSVGMFRRDFQRTIEEFGPSLSRFVSKTQAIAIRRTYDRPFDVGIAFH